MPHCACPIEMDETAASSVSSAVSLSDLSIGATPFTSSNSSVDLFQQAATSAAAALNASELIYDVVEQVLESAESSPGASPQLRGHACSNELAFTPALYPSSVLGNLAREELGGIADWRAAPTWTISSLPEQRSMPLIPPASLPGDYSDGV